MTQDDIRRGFDPDDHCRFSTAALVRLHLACDEVEWLLDRGYTQGSVLDLVGSHHQLTARQRLALQRCTATADQYRRRQHTRLPWRAASQGEVLIDGFNLIITLETGLSGSLLILGGDGVVRDLAGLRGSYRLIHQTDAAIDLIGVALIELGVPAVRFLLDQPVSNSGRLRQRILERSVDWPMPVEVTLVPNPDPLLAAGSRIVTADSALLDICAGWFNLARRILDRSVPQAWIVCIHKEKPVP